MIAKVATACGAAYALYQSYAIYQLYHPTPIFQFNYRTDDNPYEQYPEAKALKKAFVRKNRSDLEFKQPTGEVLIEPYLPLDKINQYQKDSKSQIFYLDLADIPLTQEDYFQYIYKLLRSPPELEDLIEPSGDFGVHTLLSYIAKELIRSTYENTNIDGFSYGDPQWVLYRFFKITGNSDKYKKITAPRYPIVVMDNAQKLSFKTEESRAITFLLLYWMESLVDDRVAHVMMVSESDLTKLFDEYEQLKTKVTI
jgi:hypothetical protein